MIWLGMLLAFGAGALVALSMVTQRYSLVYPDNQVPLLCCKFPRQVVWLVGLLLYAFANGLLSVAVLLSPLSLCSSLFTLLLVWNLVFVKLIIGEHITMPGIFGNILIVVGAVLTSFSAVSSDEVLDVEAVEALMTEPIPLSFLIVLAVLIAASVAAIKWFEGAFTETLEEQERRMERLRGLSWVIIRTEIKKPGTSYMTTGQPAARQRWQDAGHNVIGVLHQPVHRPPPRWLNKVMAIVYPSSLGLLEGVSQLTLKATMSMFSACFATGWPLECYSSWALYLHTTMVVVVAVATIVWLKVVYTRYEVSKALPLEYGTVNACSVVCGLVFYKELDLMSSEQITLSLSGLFLVVLGVSLSSMHNLPFAHFVHVFGAKVKMRSSQLSQSSVHPESAAQQDEACAPTPHTAKAAIAAFSCTTTPTSDHPTPSFTPST